VFSGTAVRGDHDRPINAIIRGMRLTRRNTFFVEKHFPVPLHPPQSKQGLKVSLLQHMTIRGFINLCLDIGTHTLFRRLIPSREGDVE
jgi:hypothetical protein